MPSTRLCPSLPQGGSVLILRLQHSPQHPFCLQFSAALELQNDYQPRRPSGASHAAVDVGFLARGGLPQSGRAEDNSAINGRSEESVECQEWGSENLLQRTEDQRRVTLKPEPCLEIP